MSFNTQHEYFYTLQADTRTPESMMKIIQTEGYPRYPLEAGFMGTCTAAAMDWVRKIEAEYPIERRRHVTLENGGETLWVIYGPDMGCFMFKVEKKGHPMPLLMGSFGTTEMLAHYEEAMSGLISNVKSDQTDTAANIRKTWSPSKEANRYIVADMREYPEEGKGVFDAMTQLVGQWIEMRRVPVQCDWLTYTNNVLSLDWQKLVDLFLSTDQFDAYGRNGDVFVSCVASDSNAFAFVWKGIPTEDGANEVEEIIALVNLMDPESEDAKLYLEEVMADAPKVLDA